MPLSFLRLGSFDAPPESQREKADDGRLLESWRSRSVLVYPFTLPTERPDSTLCM